MSSRYRLVGQLETGELADLYAATSDGRPVVVKLFHPTTSDARYAQELAEVARLLHTVPSDFIAKYVELGLFEDRLAVVREDVAGISLGHALQRLSTKEVIMPPTVAIALLIELLETVQLAHDGGVVHGAITPGNVYFTGDGHPAIADFGALRALQAVPELKRIFPARGRSAYRAQEVSRGEPPSELSDIYSLGAIAYELITLREAVVPNASANVSNRRDALTPPSRLDRRLNARLDPVILRALEAISTRRFRSCAEFSGALRNFLANNGGMPLREDLQKLARDLSHGGPALGPVPFTDFTLTEVDGAELEPIRERSRVLVARPAFSGADEEDEPPATPDSETQEAAPAFEEYKPEEPVFSDTDPGQVPPTHDPGWNAPPGAAPPRSKRAMSMGSQPAVSRPVPKNPRMRVHEDYSSKPILDNPFEEEDQTNKDPKRKPPRSTGERSSPRPKPQPPSESVEVALSLADPGDSSSLPTPSRELDVRGSPPRARGRGPVVWLVVALALGGATMLLISMRRGRSEPAVSGFRGGGPPREDPALRSVDGALGTYDPHKSEPPAPAPRPTPEPAVKAPAPPSAAEEADDVTFDEPPDRRVAGFLTVVSDIPATVRIDGFKVRKPTPLFKYPVAPGKRRIIVESISTQDRQSLDLVIEKGKLRRLDSKFRSHR